MIIMALLHKLFWLGPKSFCLVLVASTGLMTFKFGQRPCLASQNLQIFLYIRTSFSALNAFVCLAKQRNTETYKKIVIEFVKSSRGKWLLGLLLILFQRFEPWFSPDLILFYNYEVGLSKILIPWYYSILKVVSIPDIPLTRYRYFLPSFFCLTDMEPCSGTNPHVCFTDKMHTHLFCFYFLLSSELFA